MSQDEPSLMNRLRDRVTASASSSRSGLFSGAAHAGAGALIGFIIAWYVFGGGFFRGDLSYWRPLWGDAGSGLAALRYYVNEPWGFPLLEARGLNSPDGINVAFTDSLPALALVAKVASPLGISPERWFATWYLVIYTLQGLSAVVAVRAFGVRSWTMEATAALIAVSAPILMLRTWHPGLAGQFTLLLAWAIVGHLRSSERKRLVLALATGLCVLALLIHIYLLLGVLVIASAAVLNETWAKELTLRQAFGWFGSVGASILAVGVLGGYFTAGAASVPGYYLWGSHVLGPVYPQWSRLWPGDEWILQSSGSFEGFNWLGAGWVLLLIAAVGLTLTGRHNTGRRNTGRRNTGRRNTGRARAGVGEFTSLVTRYQVVLAAMVVLGLYALTPMVRIYQDDPHDLRTPLAWLIEDRSHHGLIYGVLGLGLALGVAIYILRKRGLAQQVPGVWLIVTACAVWSLSMLSSSWLIETVTGQFRVAGRLLWPISYGMLVAGIVLFWRWSERDLTQPGRSRVRPAVARLALVGVALVQFVDVAQFREHAATVLAPTPERIERLSQIESLVADFDLVHVEPASLKCVAEAAGANGVGSLQDLGIVASWSQTEIDSVYAARQKGTDCVAPPEFTNGEGIVTVIIVADGAEANLTEPDGFECRTMTGLVACATSWVPRG